MVSVIFQTNMQNILKYEHLLLFFVIYEKVKWIFFRLWLLVEQHKQFEDVTDSFVFHFMDQTTEKIIDRLIDNENKHCSPKTDTQSVQHKYPFQFQIQVKWQVANRLNAHLKQQYFCRPLTLR